MVLSSIAEFLAAAEARFSTSKTSNGPFVSSALPPLSGSFHGYKIPSISQKNALRLSSSISLQDFSAFHSRDPEDGDPNPGATRNSTDARRANFFLRKTDGSSFSKDKGSPGIPSTRKKWRRVILVILCLLFAFVLCASLFYYFNLSEGASEFYVVLDCGSTGTRVYVYQASITHKNSDNLPISLRSIPGDLQRKPKSQSGRAYNRMETEPGLDKLVHNISGLRTAIKPLIRWAEKQIPRHAHKTTSLFLYATAGVRRLPSSDSEWLLDNAWSILKYSPFLCKREWVKIISGNDEAFYGWIALNYHNDVLGSRPTKETFGALDMGGSSLQVTFESKEIANEETTLKLSIGPVNHRLTAYSLPGYGLNDAFDKSVSHLLSRLPMLSEADMVNGNIEIKHPCLHSGYKEQYICSDCASHHQKMKNPSIVNRLVNKGGKPGVPIQLIGAPKWDECNALARAAVNLSEWSDQNPALDCEVQPCALKKTDPYPSGKFYAISGFYVVYQFFNLTSDATLDDVLEKGQNFCEKTWDVAKNSVVPQPFIEQYCFRAPYIVFLLREGLHIIDSNVIIGSGSFTWTLGVALVEAGKGVSMRLEFQRYNILQRKISPIILIAILFASLVVLLCVLSFVGKWIPKFICRSYLPLFRNNASPTTSIINVPNPFRLQRWSPINTGEGKVKMPLSPTIADTQRRSFDTAFGFRGSNNHPGESSLYPSSSNVAHSYSSSNLGQMQFDNSNNMGSFWSSHRSQQLQSRRSQSREDLNSSLAEGPMFKI
ncbi:probable apyrase 7 [Ipomoea triloba]|uniref:probable apyrase 7 n=1 Tax=Ipomoea triloba TaxID=35885 RepID=UPI00125E934B|nr:probable apyrase 7 [Ipomoea triloba]